MTKSTEVLLPKFLPHNQWFLSQFLIVQRSPSYNGILTG